MAGILYANIRRWLTITLARGKCLRKKKKYTVTETKQKSQARVRLLVSEIFYCFGGWNQQLGCYFSAKAGKLNLKIDRTAENVITPTLSRPQRRNNTVLYVEEIHMCKAANANANESDLQENRGSHRTHCSAPSLELLQPGCHNCSSQTQSTCSEPVTAVQPFFFFLPYSHLAIRADKNNPRTSSTELRWLQR